MRVVIKKKEYDTDSMSASEIKGLIEKLQDACDMIEFQIENAEAIFQEGGEEASLVWMARARYALKRKRRQEVRVKELLAPKKKFEEAAGRTWEQCFVDICKERMDKEWFSGMAVRTEDRRIELIQKAQRGLLEKA